MPFTIHSSEAGVHLDLDGEVTIRHARELATQIAPVLEGVRTLTVGAAGVRVIDTCILQLLCSLRLTVSRFSIENPSQEFLASMDRCALRREVMIGNREEK